jgi:hypothetical protein
MHKRRLGRDQLDRSASITASVQPTKPGARPIPRPAATINVLIYLKRFRAMASTNNSLA